MKNTSVCTLGSAWEARATHIRQPPSQRGRWRSMTARQRRHFLVGAGDLGLACQTLRIVRDWYLRLHRCSRNVFAWVKFLFFLWNSCRAVFWARTLLEDSIEWSPNAQYGWGRLRTNTARVEREPFTMLLLCFWKKREQWYTMTK